MNIEQTRLAKFFPGWVVSAAFIKQTPKPGSKKKKVSSIYLANPWATGSDLSGVWGAQGEFMNREYLVN